jgi:hypothetical protein
VKLLHRGAMRGRAPCGARRPRPRGSRRSCRWSRPRRP